MTKSNGWFCRTTLRVSARRFMLTAGVAATLASAAGAVFAAGPERSLAGISIFASGSEVTRKFGNPSRILVGGVAPGAASSLNGSTSGAPGSPPGTMTGGMQGAMPGGSGGYPGGGPGLLPGLGGGGGLGGMLGSGDTGSGYPGATPGGLPGIGGLGGQNGVPAGPPPKPPVTLIYDRPNGGSLEFTVSRDKVVIQIRETGYNGAYGTSRGIKLGVKYSDVIARYGYPESTYIQGAIISIDYKDTLHCGFQFLDQRLVGIIVASPD